jgi:hypothetical protein
MKQKDVALIIVIAVVSAIISIFASKAIFAPPTNREQDVGVVQPITADFPQPDSRYFNSSVFDPAQSVTVTQNNNTNPFNGSSPTQ